MDTLTRDGRLTAVRHWSNATEQARAAAATLLAPPGADLPYRHVPTFWSDLTAPGLRIRIRAVGHTADAVGRRPPPARRARPRRGRRSGHAAVAERRSPHHLVNDRPFLVITAPARARARFAAGT
jgi:hypothetical protein